MSRTGGSVSDWYRVQVITSDLRGISQDYKADSEEDAQEIAKNNFDDIAVICITQPWVRS